MKPETGTPFREDLTQLHFRKLGQVYSASGKTCFAHSHGKVRAIYDMGDAVRAYTICYSKPDANGNKRSTTCFVDLNPDDPTQLLEVHEYPVLEAGGIGSFDEHGVMGECVIENGDELWLYYDGWTRKSSVPYDWSIGLAVSRDGGRKFERIGAGPVISSTPYEPYLFASPFVFRESHAVWHMWYLGGDSWLVGDSGKPCAVYTIRHATSEDGVLWERDAKSVIPTLVPCECQAGPSVFLFGGIYHMVFSYREATKNGRHGLYRLGHAVSRDLIEWDRCDSGLGIDGPSESWDAEMQCYPQAVHIRDRWYLFYNGNGYGRTGFGVAELIESDQTGPPNGRAAVVQASRESHR